MSAVRIGEQNPKKFTHITYKRTEEGRKVWDSFVRDSENRDSFVGTFDSKQIADLEGKKTAKFLNSKIKNPLQLPSVRGIASGPMGAVEIHGMGRQNPAKRKKLNFKFVELYRGYDIHKFNNKYYIYDSQQTNKNYLLGQENTLSKARELIDYYHDSGNHPLENPKMTKNPLVHYPKTRRGRPRKVGRPKSLRRSTTFPRSKGRTPQIKYFILDLYNSSGKLSNTLIGQGTLQTAKIEAEQFSKQRGISKVELSGPYSKRPNKDSARM